MMQPRYSLFQPGSKMFLLVLPQLFVAGNYESRKAMQKPTKDISQAQKCVEVRLDSVMLEVCKRVYGVLS